MEPLRARVSAAGTGALIYAVHWLVGAVAIGVVMSLAMELVERPSATHTALVVAQAALVIGWLVFVVARGTRGGELVLSGSELAIRRFLRWRRFALTPGVRLVRFVSRSAGQTYPIGPAVQVATTSGAMVTVACIEPRLHERLGRTLEDAEVLGPHAVVSPDDFQALLARLDALR